jgi:DNA repair exonuclease SbcCD ATPase subunit
MRELSRTKKLEVAQYYILGYPYSDIEKRTGVSHGSIVNIIKELEDGRLTVPGTTFDQVNDLRQLSFDLKKKGLESSQALLGLSLFERLRVLEITPELVEKWSELAKKVLPTDFPAREFLEAALRLGELEKGVGKPFVVLAEEYAKLKEGVDKLESEVESLVKNKAELFKEIEPLRSQLESLERAKGKLENDIEIQTRRLQELKSAIKETGEQKSQLGREIKDLQSRKTGLSSEVDSKEESLRRLNDIGLSDEDLLRIIAFIERTSKNEGISDSELKKKFFSALGLFEDISNLEKRQKAETQKVNELVKKETILSSEISELDKKKGLLEGEILGIISSTSQKVRAVGEDAASQIQQHVSDIKDQLNGLLADALKAGESIGKMRQMLKKGEESEKALANFIEEVQSRLGRN